MNRKIKWIVLFLVILLFTNMGLMMRGEAVTNSSAVHVTDNIPSDAIRLRILANSDTLADQVLKRKIRDAVAEDIAGWVKHYESKEEAAKVIEAKIPEIEAEIQSVMEKRNQAQPFTVELTETEFPAKIYGNQLYAAGTYDALKIVLGKGEGANWWCVLFPPLCFLDFGTSGATVEESNEEETEAVKKQTETEEVRVKFFLFEWLKNMCV